MIGSTDAYPSHSVSVLARFDLRVSDAASPSATATAATQLHDPANCIGTCDLHARDPNVSRRNFV